MKNILAQIKVVPAVLAAVSITVTTMLWRQDNHHALIIELSLIMLGMIGVFLTWGFFSYQKWAEKAFFVSVFSFFTALTWSLSGGGDWKNPFTFALAISIVALAWSFFVPSKPLSRMPLTSQ